jgi:type IV secretory pathway VirB3-like protein
MCIYICIYVYIYIYICICIYIYLYIYIYIYRDQELVIGVCFFVAGLGSTVFYFGTKAYLLLTGADLNAQFKIVRKHKQVVQSSAERLQQKAEGTSAVLDMGSTVILPRHVDETEKYILTLQGHLIVLLDKQVMA